ncbi:histidinol-phosphate aminotransferase [Diaminobutyricimonas aerilata]|uniref:Histidinol-phosphate aminotransferase n=1 Tax=Diaminobutyricimonas aerilata TaxID=1162967 RepID=A0A2M9CP63_9MICO|nr:histidinol-phosphate transaminase [Diaminobutyricimonas aerilata]PJJ73682.1 histidinol-phosphate aminotransferase [Diaminobutyricimonas aerilata]
MSETRVTIRPEIAALAAYSQGRAAAPDGFKLSSNENPFPPLPSVVEALADVPINRYPDGSGIALRTKIAKRYGVAPGEVQLGSGSIAVLAQLLGAVGGHGTEVVHAWRSFEAYPSMILVSGSTGVPVALREDGSHDLDAMAAAITERTRMVIVCTPNNPTGTIVTASDFEAFMAKVPPTVLVVLDEAYQEFVTDPFAVEGVDLLGRYPNLVVLRTFSKAWGLAGLRIGFALGAEYILNAARSAAIPLSVIDHAQRAALISLDHELELLERVADIAVRRERIANDLRQQGWRIPEAQGNFVWLPTGAATEEAAEVFARNGIVVRPFAPEGIRISIGERESVEALLRSAQEVVQNLRKKPADPGLD